jgi:TonB family protein
MNASQIWPNLIAYALQIGLLVGVGAVAPTVFRLRTPHARLLYWQALLVACLVLPWVQPWRQEVIGLSNANVLATVSLASPGSSHLSATTVAFAPAHGSIPFATIVLWLLLAGFVVRLLSLGIGLVRLAGYRRRGREMDSDPVFRMATPGSARWLVSDEISGPVTFGWRDPVVLLPARFPSLRTELREAILCHELLHVERRDWMFTVAEELVRAAFWFHPAIWWVLGEIQLAREQTVDQAVIEVTHACEPYVDALLAMAGAPDAVSGTLDLAPAPLFLRKRHLKQRVFGLLRKAHMSPLSRARAVFTHAGAILAIVATGWLASGVFPLSAAPQFVADAEGVTVDTGSAKLIRRSPVDYPFEALQQGIQGEVVIQATLDADGAVSDTSVINCPRELCAAAVDSLPQWRFDRRQANSTREIRIDFARPAGAAFLQAIDMSPQPGLAREVLLTQSLRPVAPGLMASPTMMQQTWQSEPTFVSRTVWMDGTYGMLVSAGSASAVGQTLNYVRIAGLSLGESAQLSSRLPVHAGDVWSAPIASIVSQVVRDFNPQLEVNLVDFIHPRTFSLWIGPKLSSGPPVMDRIAMPIGVSPPAVLSKYDAEYTDAAKSAGISGTVTLSVVVATDGTPHNIQVIGPLDPGLDQAAVGALAKWHFRPSTKDGAPVSTQARVEMSFRTL